MVIEEGMEDAAKLIQKKYRAKQQNHSKKEQKNQKGLIILINLL